MKFGVFVQVKEQLKLGVWVHALRYLCWMLMCCHGNAQESSVDDVVLCSAIYSQCTNQRGCYATMMNYFRYCYQDTDRGVYSRRRGSGRRDAGDEYSAGGCSVQCTEVLVTLLSTPHIGSHLLTCDCEGQELCEEQRTGMLMCQNDVFELIQHVHDTQTQVSCTLAEFFCLGDTSCNSAYEWYEKNCELMFLGEQCPSHCNNSLNILYHQDRAQKLRSCSCDNYGFDGEEGRNYCVTLRNNMQRLCQWTLETPAPTTTAITTISTYRTGVSITPPSRVLTTEWPGSTASHVNTHSLLSQAICVVLLYSVLTR